MDRLNTSAAPPRRLTQATRWRDGFRLCGHCRIWHPPTAFYKDPRSVDGLHSWCHACHDAATAARMVRARRAAGVSAIPRRATTAPPGMVWCPDCQDYLPRAEFTPNPKRATGVAGYCREHKHQRDRQAMARRTQRLAGAVRLIAEGGA